MDKFFAFFKRKWSTKTYAIAFYLIFLSLLIYAVLFKDTGAPEFIYNNF